METDSRIRTEDTLALKLALLAHKTARNVPLRFDNRPWLWDLYNDKSDKIVVKKASKTGISEFLLVKIWEAAFNKYNGMYVLPTTPLRNRFVTDRVDKINWHRFYRPFISKNKKDVDAKGVKNLNGSTWSFCGSNSEENFYEFDADIIILDELDKCNQSALTYAEDRTGASDADRWIHIGNPTITGYGIDQEYEHSDKKKWLVRCEHCGQWQELDWFKHFVEQIGDRDYRLRDETVNVKTPIKQGHDASPVCEKCSRPFNRLGFGLWVNQKDYLDISGYDINRLFGAPGNDRGVERNIIREIYETWMKAQGRMEKLIRFYNNILGITYRHSEANITAELMATCAEDGYYFPMKPEGLVVGGCDVGKKLHVHYSNIILDEEGGRSRKKIFIGTCDTFEELGKLHRRFKPSRFVIDALPETRKAKEFQKNRAGVYLCWYTKHDDKKPVRPDHKARSISVNKHESLDASHAAFILQDIILPCNFRDLDGGDFVKQMEAPTRVLDTKSDPPVYRWEEGNQDDHHRHADNYENISFEFIATRMTVK